MRKLLVVFVLLLAFCGGAASELSAEDTGKVLNGLCRQNLKILNEGTAKFLQENDQGLPMWGKYDTISSSLIGSKYFPKDPVGPTRDCKYYLVSVSRDDYQWYCSIHGLVDGEKNIVFQYHEHRLTAKTSSRYENIPKYAEHVRDLLRWTDYSPTAIEKFKYYYNTNPLTTVFFAVLGGLLLIFLYRNVS